MDWYLQVLQKYAVFNGRATRSEYWWFALFNVLIFFGLAFVEAALGGPGVLLWLYLLVVFIPGIAVSVRRLHDTNRTGWWLLLGLVPLGSLVLLVFYVMDSTPGTNKFGPSEKGTSPSSTSKLEDELRELDGLHNKGVLSNDEYQERRRAIISRV